MYERLRIRGKATDLQWIHSVYVRRSKDYVRGHLDLDTWPIRLRTWIEKYHYGKLYTSSRDYHFFRY